MDRLVHITLGAMKAAMARQATTAHNLANASTTGFRGEIAGVRPVWLANRAYGTEEVLSHDARGGSVAQTGRPLDIALAGDALLAVARGDGGEAYTRRGDLMRGSDGALMTGDGHRVLGDAGPIILDGDGALAIAPDGSVTRDGVAVARLKLVSAQGVPVTKDRDGLFRAPDDGVLAPDPDARVAPGALEGSNVDAPAAMVAMIEAGRAFETQVRLLSTIRELDTDTAALMRLPS